MLIVLPYLLLWMVVFRHLMPLWTAMPQYSFGFSVPLLAAYFLWQRWRTRPAVGEVFPGGLAKLGAWVLGAAIAPVMLVGEANPDWRLVGWLITGLAVWLTFFGFSMAGGWRWGFHFLFPLVFVFTSVPWPSLMEQIVVGRLMTGVAWATVWILNVAGIPALQNGNVIELSSGLVGIDDACSGVRSLQATLMVALFWGEFYRFKTGLRLRLLALGSAIAILFNVIRTSLLAVAAHRGGPEMLEGWHDPAGLAILFASMVAMWLISTRWSGKGETVELACGACGAVGGVRGVSAWLGVWLVVCIAFTLSWYGFSSAERGKRLVVAWPSGLKSLQPLTVPDEARQMLGYDSGEGATWQEASGETWIMFFFHWEAGAAGSRILARMHDPTVCLPAGGYRLERRLAPVEVSVGSMVLPFQATVFERGNRRYYVFHAVWEEHADTGDGMEKLGAVSGWEFGDIVFRRADRMRPVIERRRNLAQQVVQVTITGVADEAAAVASFHERIGGLLHLSQQP